LGVLYFLTGISVVGIAAVFWLIKNEQNTEGVSLPDLNPRVGMGISPPLQGHKPLANLLNKFGIGKGAGQTSEDKTPQSPDAFPLGVLFAKGQKKEEIPVREFASLAEERPSFSETAGGEEIKLSAGEEKKIEREIDLMAQLDEIKEQNKNLAKLFKEKSSTLEKAEESLENELRNRKEFNKLKDILEKELKESKDTSRELQMELSGIKAESESYQRRVGLLEEKVTGLEKQIIQKDDEVANLIKRLQTFAGPTTAATHPQVEAPRGEAVVARGESLAPKEEQSPVVTPETDKDDPGHLPPLPVEEGNASPEVLLEESAPGFPDLSRSGEAKPDVSGDQGNNQEQNNQNT
jgi:hypothetical protein